MTSEFLETQYELAYPDGIEHHWWHLARNHLLLTELNKLIQARSAVLDVGCGRGITVQYLRSRGIKCAGVELASARPLAGMEQHIHCGINAVDLPLEERSGYTVILLLDVIEHLADPAPFLQSLASAFGQLSHIVITAPARPELWSNYDEFYGHHRRYTPEMINDLARELGWRLVGQSYFFRPLYLPARLLAALKKDRKIRIAPPQGFAKILHRLIAYGMILEQRVLPGERLGTSILASFEISRRSA